MGFSFSALSLVTPAANELESNASVRQGDGGGLQRREGLPANTKSGAGEKSGVPDSESDWQFALYASVSGQPPQVKDTPPQASPFSAVWTSAIGTTGQEPSNAGPDSLSILAPEELAVSESASQQRLADLLAAIRGDGAAVAAADSVGTQPNSDGLANPANATGIAAQALQRHPEAGSAAAARDLASSAEASPLSDKAGHAILDLAALAASGPANRQQAPESGETSDSAQGRGLSASLAESTVPGLAGSKQGQEARGKQGQEAGRKVSRTQNDEIEFDNAQADGNPAQAKQQTHAESAASAHANAVASLHASSPAANTTNPDAAANTSGKAESAPASTRPAMQPQAGAAGAQTIAANEGQSRQLLSEIAFQGEIRLRGAAGSSDAAPANSQQVNLSRLTISLRDTNSPDAEGGQSPESKITPEAWKNQQREAFQRSPGFAGSGDSLANADHPSGGFDRGMQQTAPLSQAPGASQPLSTATPSPKPATIPAAAQLDGMAETPAPETNQPARSLTFKIQSEDRGAANVVLTDRGGQVHMTVRSSDPALAQSLRSDLGSLAGGLHQQGFDVKLWNPSSGSSTADDSRSDTLEPSHDDTRGHNRQRHSPDDTQQRGQRRGEWPEDID